MEHNKALTSRQKKALETRKLLFDTALKLILERGFDNVYIGDIAKEAGTSTGLFYKYFKSKDHIVVEHYRNIDQIYLETYEKLDPFLSATEKLVKVFKAGFIFSEGLGKKFLGVLFSNQFALREDIHFSYVMDTNRNINRIVHEIIVEGQKSQEFRTDLDLNMIVSMIFRCYTGSYFEWTLTDENKSLTDEGITFLRSFIETAIKPNRKSPSV